MSALTADEVERRLVAAFDDARRSDVEHPDLFARVTRSLDEGIARRRFRRRVAAGITVFVAANTAFAVAVGAAQQGGFAVPWWVIELITNVVLIALVVALGPFIKRFGRAYAADVFRANPRTGKSYLVLTDIAYYLIFTAYILFTVQLREAEPWRVDKVTMIQHEVIRVGGLLLLMGVLHAVNVVALPIIGRLLRSDPPGAS